MLKLRRFLKPCLNLELSIVQSKKFASDSKQSSTIDPNEVNTFSKVHDWWDKNGSMRALHSYNYARVNYIQKILKKYSKRKMPAASPLQGLDMLDVGCGGGILCEVFESFFNKKRVWQDWEEM
jgi:2-polyprenyl-3-methyl-5-hydroxy-6-metoxy-1,4-benzoquinol methylase